MLGTDDFLAALRVNKQFHAARLKKSAWPALQLDSFIQSLRDDDYDNPARRRLRLRIPIRGHQLSGALAVFSSASTTMWRHVTDVQICSPLDHQWQVQPPVDVLLPALPCLRCLTSVSFHLVRVSAAAFERFCVDVAPRLQVLLFKSTRAADAVDPLTHVRLLRLLRVLVVDELPPLQSLLPLHRLQYLHVDQQYNSDKRARAFAAVVRRLSSSHALRSLSFGEYADWVGCWPLCVPDEPEPTSSKLHASTGASVFS
jgi:hypothetical protein